MDSDAATRAQAASGSIDGTTFEERKRFCRFTAEDAGLLAELRPAFTACADGFVDEFYDHLTANPVLRHLLAEPAVVKRLKRSQRAYLISLTDGVYDAAYAEGRLRIGSVHEEIGLEPQWYLGTYGMYTELLMPHIYAHFAAEPAKAVQAGAALSKLMILDMQIVLDAYYQTRHRKDLKRSEQLAAVGELAASIAHEVRNPLAGMKGALEVLRDELSVKPSNLEIVDELLAQILRLENLVRDLLTFARPSAVNRQSFDLHELLDRLMRNFKDEADRAGITVQRIYGPGTGDVRADPQQMEQVFYNLIHNAFQAMEQGGTLTLATQNDARGILVSFRDTGKGIPPADLNRIFQPFYTTKHRGSGLGLPIVKKIVEAHGGAIEVSSVLGGGTSATMTLPVVGES